MLDGMILVDGVVHGYNWTPENWAIPEAAMNTAAGAGFHGFLTPDDDSRLSTEEFLRDWQAEGVLAQDSARSLYVYHQDFEAEGQRYTRKGFLARVRLEPFGKLAAIGAGADELGPVILRDQQDRGRRRHGITPNGQATGARIRS